MTHRAYFAAGVFALAALGSLPAAAQSVRAIGDFRDWSAYSTSEGAGALCFAVTKPRDINPIPDGYGEAWLYLTNRPAESIRNEFNLVAGYAFAPDSPATASVSGQNFDLFTENDAAWLLDPSQSDSLASAMRAGSTLVVEGTSDKGIKIAQTFSLAGVTAASKAIESDC